MSALHEPHVVVNGNGNGNGTGPGYEMVALLSALNALKHGRTGVRLEESLDCLERATDWLLGLKQNDPDTVLAGATPYLRLFALATGSAMLAQEALAALKLPNEVTPRTETVAKAVIEIAQTGIRNPGEICARVMDRIGPKAGK